MLELKVEPALPFGLHVHGHDDERASDFPGTAIDGYLAGNQTIADINAEVVFFLHPLTGLGQPSIPREPGVLGGPFAV